MDGSCFTIKIAGYNIEVRSPTPQARSFCWHYLSDGKPDIIIQVSSEETNQEIAAAKTMLLKHGEIDSFALKENGCSIYIQRINDIYLQTIPILKEIVHQLIDHDIFLMHGSVVGIEHEAFMFSASSGTGKTTHIKQWLEKAKNAFVVNGDKPLIKITDKEAIACGTPWCGKEQMGTNTMVPLKAIIFLERSENNLINEITFAEAYPFLLQQTYLPLNPDDAKKTLNLIKQLYGKTSFWRFKCNNFKEDCFEVAYSALTGKKPR